MPDNRRDDMDLGQKLMSEYRHAAFAPNMPNAGAVVDALIAQRLIVDERIRQAAFNSWLVVATCVLLTGFAYYLRGRDVELIAEAGAAATVTLAVLAVLSLILSLVLTLSWLSRTRGLAPSAIDRRLAEIEARLIRST